MDVFFVNALVRAGCCRNHHTSPRGRHITIRRVFAADSRAHRSEPEVSPEDRREPETSSEDSREQEASPGARKKKPPPEMSPEERKKHVHESLLYIGDSDKKGRIDSLRRQYIGWFPPKGDTWDSEERDGPGASSGTIEYIPPFLDPNRPLDQAKEMVWRRIPRRMRSNDPAKQRLVDIFSVLVYDDNVPREKLFNFYELLPSPALLHLRRRVLERFMVRMMTVPLRESRGMLRFLSLLSDMKACEIPITRNEWNAALSFTGRSYKRITDLEVRAVLALWKESEEVFKVPANQVTFNILIDVATKSRNERFVVLLVKEMQRRGLKSDRFTYTSLITFYGFLKKPEGIRKTYHAMIEAGEVIDNVVLNAVMTAFLRASESESAERVYRRMKLVALAARGKIRSSAQARKNPGILRWRTKRLWARRLLAVQSHIRKHMLSYIAETNATLDPDIATFNLFVMYYCHGGHWDHMESVFEDMEEFDVEWDESVYMTLMKGFVWNIPRKPLGWTRERFEHLLRRTIDPDRGPVMSQPLAVWTLRATATAYNSKAELSRVWKSIKARWDPATTLTRFTRHVYAGLMGLRQEDVDSEFELEEMEREKRMWDMLEGLWQEESHPEEFNPAEYRPDGSRSEDTGPGGTSEGT